MLALRCDSPDDSTPIKCSFQENPTLSVESDFIERIGPSMTGGISHFVHFSIVCLDIGQKARTEKEPVPRYGPEWRDQLRYYMYIVL